MKKAFPLLVVVALVCGAAAVVLLFSRQPQRTSTGESNSVQLENANKSTSGETTPEAVKPSPENVRVLSQNQKDDPKSAQPEAAQAEIRDPLDPGKVVPVRADANAQVRSVAEALKNKSHPERLSALAKPTPFDLSAFQKDPASYTGTVQPGRVFDVRAPGKDTPRLLALSEPMHTLKQGESVSLKLKTLPKMPLNAVSLDGGSFQNKLNAITVLADEQGVAEIQFFATAGTINEVTILSSSPVASGQHKFLINVLQP